MVYGKRDGDIGEQLAMELAGENPAFWDEVGMSTYWAFRGELFLALWLPLPM